MKVIRKSAAIILKSGFLLAVRKQGTDVFISPGGKLNTEEDHSMCLARELKEELGLTLVSSQPFGTFSGTSVFEDVPIVMDVSIVETIGRPLPRKEIVELAWINADYAKFGLMLASIFAKEVVPRLLERGGLRKAKQERFGMAKLVLVVDLDGTVVFDGKPISSNLARLFENILIKSDVVLAFATSRAPRGAYGVLGPLVDRSTIICCNGALIFERGHIIAKTPINEEVVRKLCDMLESNRVEYFLDYGDHFAMSSNGKAFPEMAMYADRSILNHNRDESLSGVIKIVVRHSDIEKIWFACSQMEQNNVNIYSHGNNTLEIVSANASKFNAIRTYFDLNTCHLTAFGNDDNDFEMLMNADRAYVVGNSLVGITQCTDIVKIAPDEHVIMTHIERALSLSQKNLASTSNQAIKC